MHSNTTITGSLKSECESPMLVQRSKPQSQKKVYEDVSEFDILQYESEEAAEPESIALVATPSLSLLSEGDVLAIPYALPFAEAPIAQPVTDLSKMIVPPPYVVSTETKHEPPAATKQQIMSLSEWLDVHSLGAYLNHLKAEDVTELVHFQDLIDDDVQSLVDKWQMPIRTRRTFLSAVEVLRQTLARPPSYDEPVLETNVGSVVSQLAECVEREDDRAILAIMTSHSKVDSVQEKCIEALLVLARSDVNKVSLMEADAHVALINILQTHSRSVTLLEDATGALWHIVLFADFENGQYVYRDHSNDSNKDLLIKLGLPVLLVAGLKSHPGSVKLARHSVGILWSLATAESGKDMLANMLAHVSVLDAMRSHAGDSQVQVNGCGFLWSITSRKSTHSPLCVEGGRTVVETALNTFPHVKQVQKFGILAAKKLS